MSTSDIQILILWATLKIFTSSSNQLVISATWQKPCQNPLFHFYSLFAPSDVIITVGYHLSKVILTHFSGEPICLNLPHLLLQTLPLSLLSKIQSGLSKEILPTLASQWDANLKGFKVWYSKNFLSPLLNESISI